MGISVFLTASNIDAPIIASVMASICTNTKSYINFYIIDDFLSYGNKQRIKECRKFFNNFTVDYIRIDLKPWLISYPELKQFNKDVLTKYITPTLKTDVGKAFLLDKDIIFQRGGDIAELYETDMQNYVIAASPLTTLIGTGLWSRQKLTNYEKLGLSSRPAVFDPSLILVDINKWNNENLTERLFDNTKKLLCERMLFDCYNGMFKLFDGQYHKLNMSWNVPYHYADIFFFDKIDEPNDMKALHFNYPGDKNKPWNNKELKGANYFWKYAAITTFKTYLEKNPPSKIHDPQYWSKLKFRRKALNLLIKLIVNRRKYRKLKKHTEQFFADSKSRFIRFIGELYF